jgi:hypothetical protein
MSQINVDEILPLSGNGVRVSNAFIDLDDSLSSMKITYSGTAVTGINNTYIGWGTGGSLSSGSNGNTLLGRQAGPALTNGSSNVFIGAGAGLFSVTGAANVMLGTGAGQLSTNSQNVFVGHIAGGTTTTGENNIVLGYQSNAATATTSNSITLGNSSHNVLRCAVTSITSLSDARDKKEVEDLNVGLEFIDGLRPVKFVWDDREENGKHDIADFGFIAQDLKAAEEAVEMADVLKLVYDENPEKLEASYGKLIPILVKAIQELSAEVKALKAKK